MFTWFIQLTTKLYNLLFTHLKLCLESTIYNFRSVKKSSKMFANIPNVMFISLIKN